MSLQSTAWSTEWLETLDGDRLRELAGMLFGRCGYQVAPLDQPDLDFELSQQAPMAPRVGLCCRSDAEGIDIPALRKIDAAISQNDYGFGIVAKNSAFRPEEKMFAQGKPLQLIDSEDFVKKLSQLSQEDQDAFAAKFHPTPAGSGTKQNSGSRGSGGTPDFIKKLEKIPGFGNKKQAADTGPNRPSAAPEPATPPTSGAPGSPGQSRAPESASKNPAPVEGLNLAKTAAPPPAEEIAPPPLPPLAASMPRRSAPSQAQVPGAGEAQAPSRKEPLGRTAAETPAAPSVEDQKSPSSPLPFLPPLASPPGSRTRVESAPFPEKPAKAPSDDSASKPETPEPEKSKAPLPPAFASGPSSPPLAPGSPPPIPVAAGEPSEVAGDEVELSSEPRESAKKKKLSLAAVAVLLLLPLPVFGGFYVVKKIFSQAEREPVVVETNPAPPVPHFDPEEVKALSRTLAAGISKLIATTAEIEATELAVKVATIATEAKSAGIDFVSLGGNTLLGSIAEVEKGQTIEDPDHPYHGRSFGPVEFGGLAHESVANYLVLEDNLLKFSIEARTPLPEPEPGDEEGEEILLRLESILNEQQVAAAQKNARRIAQVAKIARDAGLDFTASARRGIEGTIAAIAKGETVGNYLGSGEDKFIGLADLSEKAQRAAAPYLKIDGGELTFTADPSPFPKPAFDLVGKDLIYDLKKAASIAEKAVEHVRGRLPAIESEALALAAAQEGILAVTGEPALVTIASGAATMLLPRDFSYVEEAPGSLLITPKYSDNKEAIWLRVRLESLDNAAGSESPSGSNRLASLARSLGRPVERLGDKTFYWKNEEILEGDLLYWVTERYVGFGDVIVLLADATAKGMEKFPEAARLQEVLPGIIRSLRDTGKAPLEAAEAVQASPEKPVAPRLPGTLLRR